LKQKSIFEYGLYLSGDATPNGRIVLVTDPGSHWEPRCGTQTFLQELDEVLSTFDLCGRSWQDRPADLPEFIINTFRPVFCFGRISAGTSPIQQLMGRVNWFFVSSAGEFIAVRNEANGHPESLIDGMSETRMLVLASARATRLLLDSSVRAWYRGHVERNKVLGQDSPIHLRDTDILSDSMLASLSADDRGRIEVVVFPSPNKGGRSENLFKARSAEDDTFIDLRINYLRRAHMCLGCEKHSIW
jgi:hypothetical protein